MVWIAVVVTGVVGMLAALVMLAWWHLARRAFRYPDEEEAVVGETSEDPETIVVGPPTGITGPDTERFLGKTGVFDLQEHQEAQSGTPNLDV
jgi:hypothetical protein